MIPDQGYTRGSGLASIDHRSGRFNVGATASGSRITTNQGEGGGAYGYALAGALIATFTVTPTLASLLLPEQVAETETRIVRTLHRVYDPVLRFVLAHRPAVIGVGLLTLAAAGFLAAPAVRIDVDLPPQPTGLIRGPVHEPKRLPAPAAVEGAAAGAAA